MFTYGLYLCRRHGLTFTFVDVTERESLSDASRTTNSSVIHRLEASHLSCRDVSRFKCGYFVHARGVYLFLLFIVQASGFSIQDPLQSRHVVYTAFQLDYHGIRRERSCDTAMKWP